MACAIQLMPLKYQHDNIILDTIVLFSKFTFSRWMREILDKMWARVRKHRCPEEKDRQVMEKPHKDDSERASTRSQQYTRESGRMASKKIKVDENAEMRVRGKDG